MGCHLSDARIANCEARRHGHANVKFTSKSEKYFHMREHIDNGAADPLVACVLCSIFKTTWNKWVLQEVERTNRKCWNVFVVRFFFSAKASGRQTNQTLVKPSTLCEHEHGIELWNAWMWKKFVAANVRNTTSHIRASNHTRAHKVDVIRCQLSFVVFYLNLKASSSPTRLLLILWIHLKPSLSPPFHSALFAYFYARPWCVWNQFLIIFFFTYSFRSCGFVDGSVAMDLVTQRISSILILSTGVASRTFVVRSHFTGSFMLHVLRWRASTRWCCLLWRPDDVALKFIVIFTSRLSYCHCTRYTGSKIRTKKNTNTGLCVSPVKSLSMLVKHCTRNSPETNKIENSARKTMNVETASPKICKRIVKIRWHGTHIHICSYSSTPGLTRSRDRKKNWRRRSKKRTKNERQQKIIG